MMNQRQFDLAVKNLRMNKAFLEKDERKGLLTDGQRAQRLAWCTIWAEDVKEAMDKGLSESPSNPGAMSAGSSMGVAESASPT